MSRLTRDESGFTLVELLIVCVLMLIVLGATLTTLNSFESNAQTNNRQNDSQQEARRGMDQLARELRNLASPTNEHPDAIKRNLAQDLIVQTVADVRPPGSENLRNTQFVRYCYDASANRVVRQKLTWITPSDPESPPSGTACPADGWTTTDVAAQDVVNGSRPLFTYNSVDVLKTTEIHTSLYVDVNPGSRPKEASIFTTVFLRNQNRVPIAHFSAVRDGTSIVLNGSDSQDPEERALYYDWYDPAVKDLNGNPTPIGTGIVYVYKPTTPGNHTVYLEVRDQANLKGTAPSQTICIPGGTTTCST